MRSRVPVWQTVNVEFIGQWSLMLLLLLKGAGQMSERLPSSVPPAWFRLLVKPFPDGTGDLSSSPFQATAVSWILTTHLLIFILDVYIVCFCMQIVLRVYVGVFFLLWLCKVWTSFMVEVYASQKAMWINHSLRNIWVYATQGQWHNPSRTWINILFVINTIPIDHAKP